MPIGTFLKIVPVGLPEKAHVNWISDAPDVLSIVPHTDHCQVQITGVGKGTLTASFNGIKKPVVIVGTENEPVSVKDLDDFALTYAGVSVTEFTESIGQETAITAVNLPIDSGEVIWSADSPDVVKITPNANSCFIEGIGTGKAVVSAYCGGKSAAVTVYIREAW